MDTSTLALHWSDAIATGIDTVDAQHQRLFKIFNQAALAQAQGAGRADAISLLGALVDYTHYHFREEADLMRQWPVNAMHRTMHLKAHESFSAFLRQAQALAQEQPAEVVLDLLTFLAQWLLHHIMGVDARMAREIHILQAGGVVQASDTAESEGAQDQLIDAVNQLTDALGQRTLDLLAQRQRLLDLQNLYRALLRSGEVLIQSRDEHEMLQNLCAKLAQDTPFHAAWVGRPGQSGVFDVLALSGEGADQVHTDPPRLTHQDTASVVSKAWNTQRLIVCNDTLADPTLQPWHEGVAKHQWLSALAVPIMRAERVWAVLVLAAPRRAIFDERTIEVCTRIVALLGFGLDELDLKTRIQTLQTQEAHMARTDALTGLPNRFALEEYLPQAIARAHRRESVLAIGMIDLDDFKPVNDHFGHEAGDVLLRAVAKGLRERLRESDFIARIGGDEFVVVLEELDAAQMSTQLKATLTRLHKAVEDPCDLGQGRAVSVDMTMGLALYPLDGTDADLLLRQADAAMYQAKQSKIDRVRWWRIGAKALPEQMIEAPFDPFGGEAQQLMQALTPHLASVAEDFAASFYGKLQTRSETAAILACLSPDEFATLQRRQTAHLRFLLDAQTTEPALQETARHLGTAHALVGVSGAQMTQTMGLYRDLLRAHLDTALLSARARYRTLRAADARLQLDILTELQAMQSTLDMYQTHLARPMDDRVMAADWRQTELNALAKLPGLRAAVIFRPDAQNQFIIERAAGEVAQALIEKFDACDLYPMMDPRHVRGTGLVATTWMTHTPQHTNAFVFDARTQPWSALMHDLGIRSAVTIPLYRHGEMHAVLEIFGAYPRQFASGWMQPWRVSLQNRWDQMMRVSQDQTHPIDSRQAADVRALLYSGGLQMVVQPIVDLRSGTLVSVEALARLRTPEGATLAPAQFLSALGETDLDALFRQGLAQSLGHLHRWHAEELAIGLSINLAPSTLVHPDCASWVETALRDAQVAPQHLTLELLESQAFEKGVVDEAITRLVAVGVKLAMDDLGSGYSSLKRLRSLPFDAIKIDQDLIKDLASDPIKALSIIRTVVQIGQDFERIVVAEGLEDDGVIEAVSLLGCQFGQGYGLARPMPADMLISWVAAKAFRGINETDPQSWIGALAYQWTVMHDPLRLRHPGDLASCPLTRFLNVQDVRDPEVLGWHAQIHQSRDGSTRLRAIRQMMHWLSNRVCAGTNPG